MQKTKRISGTRAAGYYVMLIAAALALAENILYYVFYQGANLLRYYSNEAFMWPFIGIIGCLVLSTFKVTHRWAPWVLYGFELYAFCLFVDSTYMYLSSAFFGGISMTAILSLSPGFLLCAILYIVVLVLSMAAALMKGRKEMSNVA